MRAHRRERTTGGENVESDCTAMILEGVEVTEDMDMEEDMSEDTEDAEEPEEMPEEEPEEISPSVDADTEKADMTLSLTSETEEMKAGKTIRYRVDLANTGDVDLDRYTNDQQLFLPEDHTAVGGG